MRFDRHTPGETPFATPDGGNGTWEDVDPDVVPDKFISILTDGSQGNLCAIRPDGDRGPTWFRAVAE